MSALPTLLEVTAWLATLRDLRADPAQQSAAAANVLVAYGRAEARARGLDEHYGALAALEHVHATSGERAAYDVAARADVDLDRMREEDVAERHHQEREAELEASIQWGAP